MNADIYIEKAEGLLNEYPLTDRERANIYRIHQDKIHEGVFSREDIPAYIRERGPAAN